MSVGMHHQLVICWKHLVHTETAYIGVSIYYFVGLSICIG